jgi:hypothetical protein
MVSIYLYSILALAPPDIPRFYSIDTIRNKDCFTLLIREKARLLCEYFAQNPDASYEVSKKDVYENWKLDRKASLQAKCFLEPEDIKDLFQSFDGRGSPNNRAKAIEHLKRTGKKYVLRYCSLKDTDYYKAYSLTLALNNDMFEHYAIVYCVGDGYYFGVKAISGNNVVTAHSAIKSYSNIVDLLEDQIKNLGFL